MNSQKRDERGQSVSVFITVVFAALIMTAGLVIDQALRADAVAGLLAHACLEVAPARIRTLRRRHLPQRR